jgi:hypothetical protein
MTGGGKGSTKVIKSGGGSFAKGGSGKMFGRQTAGPKTAGITGKAQAGSGGKWAKGGSGHMFGRQNAGTRVSGKTGK